MKEFLSKVFNVVAMPTVFAWLAVVLLMAMCPVASKAQQAAGPVSLAELEEQLKQKPEGPDLLRKVEAVFGKWSLNNAKAGPKVDRTTVGWAVKSDAPVSVIRLDNGEKIGDLTPLGEGVQALVITLPNFQDFDFEVRAGAQVLRKGHLHIEYYEYTEDSEEQPDVPKGEVTKHEFNESKIFEGTTREYLVYVPAQYDGKTPAALIVFQDGLRHADPEGMLRATTVLDNLIAKGEIPVTVGLFVDPGRLADQKPGEKPRNRSVEYDSLGDAYVRFLLEEIIPKAVADHDLKLSDDPKMWTIAGGSSGAACAWTAAWERPDKFGNVISWVGTFVDIRGANAYPSLIRKTERKPIRVYLLDGENDLDNKFGNWPLANQQMQKALEFMGYDYAWHYGKCFHGSRHAGPMLPEMLRWVWGE